MRYMLGFENVDSQRISFRGKKWWFPLLKITYQAVKKENIVLNIVQAYLGMYKKTPFKSTVCGSSSSSRVHPMVRTDGEVEEHSRELQASTVCAVPSANQDQVQKVQSSSSHQLLVQLSQ